MDTQKRIGVFLDQVLPFVYRDQINESKYYENIDRTLKKLKLHFNLDKIVIAEHPESAALVNELRDKFVNFERYRGDTQKLIKNSTYVFAHYSTSIGIAVFYKKPIFLLNDDNLRNVEWIIKAIQTYQKILGLTVVDMERGEIRHLKDWQMDKKLYLNYVEKYMKDSLLNEKSYHYAIKQISGDLGK